MSNYMNIVETFKSAQIIVFMYRLIESKLIIDISMKIRSTLAIFAE